MKQKLLALFLAMILCLGLAACGSSGSQEEQRDLTDDEWAAVWATEKVYSYLMDNLKKPSSLEINSISGGKDKDDVFFFEIDYSAENGFGGTGREKMYVAVLPSASKDGCAIQNYGSPTFYSETNQQFTKQFYMGVNPSKFDVDFIFGEVKKLQ